MKKFDWLAVVCGLLLIAVNPGSAQPAFQNLDFESPNLPIPPLSFVPFSNAFPGWTGYFGSDQVSFAYVNAISLGTVNFSLMGPNLQLPQFELEGDYAAFILCTDNRYSTGIAQTGLIPTTAQSVQMKIATSEFFPPVGPSVTIGGQNIPMVPLQVTTGYALYGGDIAAFAGKVEELRIMGDQVPPQFYLVLESVEFSPRAIPEPRNLSLITGGFFLAIHIAKRRRLKASRV